MDGLYIFDREQWTQDYTSEWGGLPAGESHGLLCFGSRLLVATERGVSVLRGTGMTLVRGSDGLPVEDVRGLARGFGKDYWAA